MAQAAWQRHSPLDWLREINAQVSTLAWIKLRTVTTHTHSTTSVSLARIIPTTFSSPQPLFLYIVHVHTARPRY